MCYHTLYADRQRTYPSTAAMVADGFSTTSVAYRAASIYFEQNPGPQNVVIGRRASAYSQVLDLLCTDATSGDLYAFTAIGSDDIVHPISVTSTGVAATDAQTIVNLFSAKGGPVKAGSANTGTLVLTIASGTATANGTLLVTITLGGATGTATFSWTYTSVAGVLVASGTGTTSASSALSGSGLTADFGSGTAVIGDTYTVNTIINCGTVSLSTATVVFTQASGKLTDIVGWMDGPVQNIQLTDATADPGITADLTAIYNANTLNWYGFALDSNSKLEDLAAMAWAGAQSQGQKGKFFFTNNSDAANVNLGGASTSDLFATAQSDSYQKAGALYSGQEVLAYSGVSMMSYAMAQTPGRWVMAAKSLPGCLTDTDTSLTLTQALVLNTSQAGNPAVGGKNGNYYYQTNGQSNVWPGSTPFGQYIDYPIWIDYIDVQIQAAVLAAKNAGPKLSYDANGLQVIYQAILGQLVAAATPDGNGNVAVLMSSIIVNVPTMAEIAAASILNRDVPNCTWSCLYVGGIQTVESTGSVTL